MKTETIPVKGTSVPVVLFALASAICAATAEDSPGMTSEDVVDLRRVSQVALSPSAERVAYVLNVPRGPDEEMGGRYSEIWVVPTDGGESRQFTSKPQNSSSVDWSPDGTMLTFLSKRAAFHEQRQLFSLPVSGGEAMPLTRHETGVESYAWSPDGTMIAYLAADAEKEERKKAREKGRDWIVKGSDLTYHRVWILDVAKGRTRPLYNEKLNTWSFIWAPGGKSLALQMSGKPLIDESFMDRQIYTIPLTGGSPARLCKTPGKLGDMEYSPDGKQLAFLGAVSRDDPLAQSVFVVRVDSESAPRNLTPDTRTSAMSLRWLNDRIVVVLAVANTETTVYAINTAEGRTDEILRGGAVLSSWDVDAASRTMAVVASRPEHPDEAYVVTIGKHGLKRLTHSNPDLSKIRLARQDVAEWKAPDGMTIRGVLTYPLDHDSSRRFPLALQVHGGPEGVSLNGWRTRAGYPVQVLAARGFVVLEPNYRGSAGRGVAFSRADHHDLGGAEFDDVLAGIEELVHRGLVDKDRVASGGWSYGGYFSAWAATRHSERFRAAVMCAGISNWVSFAGTTDIPHEMALVHWHSYWFERPELHWERSPLAHLDRARTPTLIVHGLNDLRVPPAQGIELHAGLELKKVPTELILYPREPHGLNERAHQIDFIERCVAWFVKHLE